MQACVKQKLLCLKKVSTLKNVSDLNTKNLSVARRRYLFGLCGLSEDQKKISTTANKTTNMSKFEMKLVQRVAMILAGLPMSEAVSLQEVSMGISSWSCSWWILAFGAIFTASILGFMMSGSGSRSPSNDSHRYRNTTLTEASDPDEWMRQHHHYESGESMDDGETEGPDAEREPAAIDPENVQRLDRRIFMIFFVLVDSKYTQCGRRIQPQFAHEVESWTPDETLLRTFKQLRVLALCLDVGKIHQVEEMLSMSMLDDGTGNDDILAELHRLESEYVSDMTLTESIQWLYERYRPMMIGSQYDKVKWAAEVFSSEEEKMRVSQERALDAIQERIDEAWMRGDQDEVDNLEALHRNIGLL